jgi:MauM/NapG family ferredoxin protein
LTLPEKHKRARRPRNRWVTARKTVQTLALVAFMMLFIAAGRAGAGRDLAPYVLRIDPLVVLTHLLSNRIFLAGSVLALILVLLGLMAGRAWCGWLCPLGTMLDVFSLSGWRRALKGSSTAESQNNWDSLRSLKYGLLLTTLFAAFLGNLTLLIFDPLTLLFRSLTASLWPMLDQVVTALEMALYRTPLLSEPVAQFDAWIRPRLLPAEPLFYRETWLFAAVFLGVIFLNLLAPRFWCRYLCPLGAFMGLLAKFSIVRRRVTTDCKTCTLCTRTCPTGTIDPAKGYASDPGECTLCLDCLEACPRDATRFTPRLPEVSWNTYDPGRRQALAAIGAGVAALALFRSDALSKREHPHALRPPGARENDLLAKCLRCGECMRACPTTALQPSLAESGAEGLWTPILIPRLGYCDYACNACGQICPVEAIPLLDLASKRQQVIGKAYLDQNRCLAWSDHVDCIVCEEMCPLPEKAIYLSEEALTGEDRTILLPHVDRQQCIGCGICEYKCPVNGQAAIRVYVPEAEIAL